MMVQSTTKQMIGMPKLVLSSLSVISKGAGHGMPQSSHWVDASA